LSCPVTSCSDRGRSLDNAFCNKTEIVGRDFGCQGYGVLNYVIGRTE
jgi:hypothetical protein